MNSVLAMKLPPSLLHMKPKTAPEKRASITTDILIFTPEMISKLKLPPGQRPLKENAKVRALSEEIKREGGFIPGIITLGSLNKELYIIDGQHRLHAFQTSCAKEACATVRMLHADSMKEIHREFVELNSRLVTMRPDDFLRGMEDSLPCLQAIRSACPFVGYDQIRRQCGSGPIVSMSATLRCWKGGSMDVPSSGCGSAMELAESLIDEEARQLSDFLLLAHRAFGRDVEFRSLWSNLNMTLCMWLYRRMVITQYSPKTPRLDKPLFEKCLMSLSADGQYLNWLVGRQLGERDRSPAYARIKALFARRLEKELGKRVQLPSPAWCSSQWSNS